MECVGTLSWNGMGLAWPAKQLGATGRLLGTLARPLRREQGVGRLDAAVAPRPRQIPDGKELAAIACPAQVEVHTLEIESSQDWSQIVRRCMDGDSSAWAELVRAQHRRVYALCYRFTGNPADAEDLTQDVFLKIYSNLASFDTGRGSLQVWITTMTRNLLVDNFRRTKNLRATGSLDDGWESAEELKPVDRLTSK